MGKRSRSQREKLRRRRQHMRQAGVALVALVCICALTFIGYAIFAPEREPQSAYYLEDQQSEVLAPPFVVENEVRDSTLTDEEIERMFAPDPQPTVPPMDSATFTLTAVGDCTLGGVNGSNVNKRFQEAVAKYGVDYFFDNVRSIFEEDDITLANFEGVLTTATKKRPERPFNFKGSPEYVGIVAGSSVEVCTLANNHAYDYLQQGFDDTVARLEENDIQVCGFGLSCVENVRGVNVGFLGFTEWDYTQAQIVKEVEAMRENCDVLVVSMHWGSEKRYSTTDNQRRLAHAVVDAGADLVIGHHPHVVGEIENYKGVQIVYSLGNFCFSGNDHPYDTDAIIYQQTFVMGSDGVGSVSAKIYPISVSTSSVINDFHPVLLTGEDATRVLKKIAQNSDEEGLALVEAVQ